MPSFRVEGSSVSLSMFDVVGKDGNQPRFIDHAGLANSETACQAHAVAVLDMAPPLHGPAHAALLHANAIGRAELNDDEVQKLRIFVDLHAGEHASLSQLNRTQILRRAPEMYSICPHVEPFREDDGRYVRTRFSCAGFVLEAYRSAQITLLDPNDLPMVNIDVLRIGYPVQMQLLESGMVAADSLGLKGESPWPVLLCGYLFHSLSRPANEIREEPYVPTAGDWFFTHEDEES